MTNDENNEAMSAESGTLENPGPGVADAGGGFGTQAVDASEDENNPDPGASASEIANLKDKAAKADENWNKYVRAIADLENYKKRAIRERQDAVKYANEGLVEKLLPIMDNFEAALVAANAGAASPGGKVESLKTGINMIFSQLKNVLGEAGIEEIDAANKPFDPNLHEAVSQQASAEVPEGHVLQQMRKGYRLRDRLIRPAMVVVAKKP